MPRDRKPEQLFSARLTEAQRKLIAQLEPDLADRLKLEQPNQRKVAFTWPVLKSLQGKVEAALGKAEGGAHNTLRHALVAITQALHSAEDPRASLTQQSVFQFKITLLDTRPPVWRRIQVGDCTLDRLHEYIQTAMGWTNSHLHDFTIGGKKFADPMLMEESFEELGYADSTTTNLSDILPTTGKSFRFEYLYDFGDSWRHEVLFEGMVPAEKGNSHPLCLEGERACPPEDVGGTPGYEQFLEALSDPQHEQHEELREWVGGRFDPRRFSPATATRRMRKRLPDWRNMP